MMMMLRYLCAAALLCLTALPAQAASHALILWLGEYGNPNANLPGIDQDARMAKRIAATLGAPESNVYEYKNRDLTLAGFRKAFQHLRSRVASGDRAFIYYSGHGGQDPDPAGGKRCIESMITYDMRDYLDSEFTTELTRLGEKASQIVVLNDSCFSGGQFDELTRSVGTRSVASSVPKLFKRSADQPGYRCGDAINAKVSRAVERVKRGGANIVYLAASADDEVAGATSKGSIATIAWDVCLKATDSDRSGLITGREVLACAQREVDRLVKQSGSRKQTVTLLGAGDLPLFPAAAAPALPVPAPSVAAPSAPPPAASVDPSRTLENLRQLGSPTLRVDLRPAATDMKIGSLFEFTVQASHSGYLYVLQVGTDGKLFTLLFPNDIDRDNRISAGLHRFPRDKWRVRVAGKPPGTSYLMAVVSERPRDFLRGGAVAGSPFRTGETTAARARSLVIESTADDQAEPGRFGASAVVAVRENP